MNSSPFKTLGATCAIMALTASFALGQTARIQNQIISERSAPPTAGRDFWFAMPSNYWGVDNGGKYMRIYISSTQNTTAYVSVANGTPVPVSVAAGKIGIYAIPEALEMESSGYVEAKGIHVWSNDANLSVYEMSHNAYTSDGSYVLPTIGLGTDYVVAAYGSLYELNWDDPSEFTVTATRNNTILAVTPSCDFRYCPSGNESGDSCSKIVGFPAGKQFFDTLERGQSIEFKPVLAQAADGYDVTGTVLHSNVPVAVIGACDCANIPADFPYCDHVEHMIPPVRTWGTTYYSSSFIQPPTMPGHDFALYLIVSSKPNQLIYRLDYASGPHVECILSNKYNHYWDELEGAQKFYSDAPFMLVEYMNGSTYPDNVNGSGDPAEMAMNSREQYSRNIIFQAPVSVGAQAPYDNYATLIISRSDESRTTYDGRGVMTYTRQPIDDTFDAFTVPHLRPGVHIITGDSDGVGVNIYGYGYDESYAWSGALGLSTFNSPDTLAPKAMSTGACYQSFVHLADSGYLPKTSIAQSGITSIQFDSSYNMSYVLDPNWVEGAGADTSGYSLTVTDPSKPAFLSMEVFDQAGNRTLIVSNYVPQTASIEPPIQIFGKVISPATKTECDTLVNTGTRTYRFNTVSLLHGNLGFTLDSGTAPDTLRVGERRAIKIRFQAVTSATVIDSLILEDDCGRQSAALIGNGGVADFLVTDQQWLNEPLPAPPNGYVKTVTIENLSNIPITIDSVWWADTVHFKAVSSLPITLSALGTVPFSIAYFPDDSSAIVGNRTQGNWQSLGNAVRTDSLVGSAASAAVGTATAAHSEITLYPNPTTGMVTISDASGPVQVTNVLGERVMPVVLSVQRKGALNIDLSQLPAGTYFVRVTEAGGQSTFVKVVKQGD